MASGLAHLAGTANPLLSGTARGLWSPLGRVSRAVRRGLDAWLAGPRTAILGVAHGLFPCPLLYPAYLYALARGDPLEGAAALAVLGAGTVPSLFLYGTLVSAAPQRWLTRVHRGLGVAFLVLGYLPLSHGLVLLGVPVPFPPVEQLLYQPVDTLVGAANYCLPG
ncbi:MAG: sulfite exporter TauE/SafE family protein [Halorientalis sp.]